MSPEEFYAKTEFGEFCVKINDDFISVGDRKFCVQISYKSPTDIELSSLETRSKACEANNKNIYGELTVRMVHLAFTILKENYPLSKIVNLIDTSSFVCEGRPMGLMKSSLLLYGATYYERKFGAKPQKKTDELKIEQFRKHWSSSSIPEKFHFNNTELSNILTPIYKTCSTWAEFANKLNAKYGREVCKYIYPWFIDANYKIYDDEITSRWYIDIEDKSNIPYLKQPLSGGNRSTLKNTRYEVVYRQDWDRQDIHNLRFSTSKA